MKMFEKPEEESPMITIRNKNHKHSDIFNTRDANYLVIRNDEPVVKENVFQKKIDDAMERYEGSHRRPSSGYNRTNVTYQEGSYAFNQDWASPNQFSSKTMVNESANFEQDYHHKRRFQENSSSVFPVDSKDIPKMYRKNIEPVLEKTKHPNQSEIFGRKNILKQEINKTNEESKKYGHNYSNLFGLGERIEKIKEKEEPQSQTQSQTLIPSGLLWEQYDSVLQNGCRDQEVGEDYHKKRNLENMKSSMDTHNEYESYNPQKKIPPPINEIADIVGKYGHLLGKNDENNERASNCIEERLPEPPKTEVITKKTAQRPNSAMKPSAKSQKEVQIIVTKGLTSKFNLNTLCEQCRLHSLVLSQYNNSVAGEKGTGRGTIKVVPQKKYGLDVLCSWLRAQGLSILVRGA